MLWGRAKTSSRPKNGCGLHTCAHTYSAMDTLHNKDDPPPPLLHWPSHTGPPMTFEGWSSLLSSVVDGRETLKDQSCPSVLSSHRVPSSFNCIGRTFAPPPSLNVFHVCADSAEIWTITARLSRFNLSTPARATRPTHLCYPATTEVILQSCFIQIRMKTVFLCWKSCQREAILTQRVCTRRG